MIQLDSLINLKIWILVATRLGSRSLFSLSFEGCRRLESFPEIEGKMESLYHLNIEKSGIRELPSIAYVPGLCSLNASGCELQNIQLLPFGKKVKFDEVSSWGTNLHLEGCNLSESDFLVPLDCWSALTALNLSRNNFVTLPDCISEVVNLETLFLRGCKRLREIPVLPSKLKELELDDCTSLEKIPKLPLSLKKLSLCNCKRLREIPVLPSELEELELDDCTSLEKIPKLPPRLEKLSLCNCSGLSGDEVAKNLLNEVAKLRNRWLNLVVECEDTMWFQVMHAIDPHSELDTIYPGNEVPKWFSYTSNHPTTIQPLPEYKWDEYERKQEFVGGSEYRFEIPLKLQYGYPLLGLALSFVLEPPTDGFDIYRIIINRKKLVIRDESTDLKATHVRVVIAQIWWEGHQGDICPVVFRFKKECAIKSCGVHCLLRNQDSGSSYSEDEEDEEQEQEQPSDSDIEEDEDPMQRAQLQQQQQQQQQLRQHQFQQPMQPLSSIKRPYDSGVCARRLMQYLQHQQQRPADNSIAYWRKFVTEYYSPRAKKRWCLSLYENVGHHGHHAPGVFPQAAMNAWQCDICGSKYPRLLEATFEVLPRLNEIKFGSGLIDELFDLDLPRECRSPSDVMMLEYGKAVQESVYERLRVVREGKLRIIFTQDLKILSWGFCARQFKYRYGQVNQLVQVAQKCQSTIAESGSDGISQQDLQTNRLIEGLKVCPRHATANSDNSTGGGGNNTYNQRAPDLPSNLHFQEDLVSSDIVLRPTSSLGKRPHPRGSSDIVDDEYDHPKHRRIDIEEEEEQEQPSASDDPQFKIS